ncbi:MAG: caspase family protein [Lewinella sp.]|nr:caspase family protein [Lewinella sp.]
MATGISLHIGINHLDTNHYWLNEVERWDGRLKGCENDAEAMEKLAKAQGFTTTILRSEAATRENVTRHILAAKDALSAGDIFFLTFSGHGGQVDDFSGDEEENDPHPMDETLCLFDGQLLDDELFQLWEQFGAGVRILFLSDSCHSGTISKGIDEFFFGSEEAGVSRLMPRASTSATYTKNLAFYLGLQSPENRTRDADIRAHILQLSGCRDGELSLEDQNAELPHGFFSRGILTNWNPEKTTDYTKLFESLEPLMPERQHPSIVHFGGSEAGRLAFLNSKPFMIG